jgi:hypothetical protein
LSFPPSVAGFSQDRRTPDEFEGIGRIYLLAGWSDSNLAALVLLDASRKVSDPYRPRFLPERSGPEAVPHFAVPCNVRESIKPLVGIQRELLIAETRLEEIRRAGRSFDCRLPTSAAQHLAPTVLN